MTAFSDGDLPSSPKGTANSDERRKAPWAQFRSRLPRYLMIGIVGVGVLFYSMYTASRMAVESLTQGIAAERATGLASLPVFSAAPAESLIERFGDLRITRAATLGVVTRDLEQARAVLDSTVREQNGHFAEFKTFRGKEGKQWFEAKLRVPTENLKATLTSLRRLGRVTQESEAGEEISQEGVQAEFKLTAAKETLRRLESMAGRRDGKVGELLEVEERMAGLRKEIRASELQLQTYQRKVEFAAIQLSVFEEYRAQFAFYGLGVTLELRNAAVEGARMALTAILSLGTIVLRYAPTVVLLGMVAMGGFFPLRKVWRRFRVPLNKNASPQAAA